MVHGGCEGCSWWQRVSMSSIRLRSVHTRWSVGTWDIVVIVGQWFKVSSFPVGKWFTEDVKGVVGGRACPWPV